LQENRLPAAAATLGESVLAPVERMIMFPGRYAQAA